MKKNKGITLVALVVTIVVLLILAGVSINLVLGNNGIIAKAKEEADGYAIKLSKCDFSSQESSVQICAELNRIGEYGYWNVSISVSPLKELEETILGESYPSFTKEGIEEYFTNQNILFGEKLQAYLCPSLYAKKKA